MLRALIRRAYSGGDIHVFLFVRAVVVVDVDAYLELRCAPGARYLAERALSLRGRVVLCDIRPLRVVFPPCAFRPLTFYLEDHVPDSRIPDNDWYIPLYLRRVLLVPRRRHHRALRAAVAAQLGRTHNRHRNRRDSHSGYVVLGGCFGNAGEDSLEISLRRYSVRALLDHVDRVLFRTGKLGQGAPQVHHRRNYMGRHFTQLPRHVPSCRRGFPHFVLLLSEWAKR